MDTTLAKLQQLNRVQKVAEGAWNESGRGNKHGKKAKD